MGATATFDSGVLRSLIEGEVELRYQDPKIEKHGDHYRIRPYVPVVSETGAIVRARKSIILGRLDEMKIGEAKVAKQRVMATINAGKIIVQSQIPFGELCDKFVLARVPQLEKSTQAKYTIHIKNHVKPAFGHLRLCEIDQPAVEIWMNAKRENLAWATCADLKNILSAIFKKAKDWKLWDGDNPCEGVSLGKSQPARQKKLLTMKQFAAYLSEIRDSAILSAAQVRAIVLIAVYGGPRISEVLGLRWQDINEATGQISIVGKWYRGTYSIPKTPRSTRTVRVGPAAAMLALLRPTDANPDAFVFAREDGNPPIDGDLNQHVLRPAAERIGVYFKGFGMHTFRRSAVSWRQQAGATPVEAMVMAGHTRLDMTALYTIVDDERDLKILGNMESMMKGGTIQ